MKRNSCLAPRSVSMDAPEDRETMWMVSGCTLTHAPASDLAEIGERPARAAKQKAEIGHLTELFARSLEAAGIGVWECNLDGEQLRWTDVVYDIFDLPHGSRLQRREILQFYSPASQAELERIRTDAILRGRGFTLDAQIRTIKGVAKWIRITATVEWREGIPVRIFGLKQDITTEKLLAARTRYLAEHDSLTGLANRVLFQASLDALCETSNSSGTLMLLDLDGFKEMNDRFGHAQGDACLQRFADSLKAVCSDARVVARIGGDEFAVLFDHPQGRDDLAALADRIIQAVRPPDPFGATSFDVGVSIGISNLGDGPHSSDPACLFTDADLALYAAKAAGKNTFRFFEHRLRDEANLRLTTLATIDAALAKSELTLHYQPMVRLSDGRLRGFEALLRHRGADGRLVGPRDFQVAMDDPELARRLGQWVLKTAIAQAARWQNAQLGYGCLSINIGQAQLNEGDFAQKVLDEIARHRLPPQSIEIEITEGVFLDDDAGSAVAQLSLLQSRGVRIALDDFGTGYASLVHLRNYPIDVIKVDRSFISDVLASASDAAILECLVLLARRLGKTIVVEGVETPEQLAYLRSLDCECAQGNLFAPALAADHASRLMQTRRPWPPASTSTVSLHRC